METDGSRHSIGRCEGRCDRESVEIFPSQSDARNDCNNEVIVKVAGQGTPQFMHDISKDVCLPKFTDHYKQNVVHFLEDLESYFHLRGIPDSFKLVLAKSAVQDSYTSQWISTVYKDLSSYEQFKKAITEFLWGPQAQARWRSVLYQSMYDGNRDGSMTAHFLRYSAIASNLTPKLTESEIVEIISGHYPAYVQRTMLSAGVRTIRDALNLLNRLESLEADRKEDSNLGSYARNRANQSDFTARTTQDRSYRARPGFQNVRNMRYQSTRNNDRNWQQGDSGYERGCVSSGRGRQDIQSRPVPSRGNENRRILNPEADDYAQRNSSGEFNLNATEINPVN
jgi:hypothetical protein